MKRVVVTGIGCISSIGSNVKEFCANLFQGCHGFGPISLFDASDFHAGVAAEVKDYDETGFFSDERLAVLDRYAQFALISTREAVDDAQIGFTNGLEDRTAVIHGSGVSSQSTQDKLFYRLYVEKRNRFHPFTVPKTMTGCAASQISMEYGITGPTFTTASACSSAAHAIATACMMIRTGMVDAAVTGGSEAPVSPGLMLAWEALRVMSKSTCRPFSADRSGMVIGEGAGTLVLESLEHAQSRGARIYGELAGIGMTSDVCSMLHPAAEGPASAMQAAIEDANLSPEDIQYINAHGTGTPQNDPTETKAVRAIFNGSADRLAVSSTKSMHGHALGAAAALESIATLCAIQKQSAPPTMGYLGPDPECDLDYVPNHARPMEINAAVCNSFAFGGLNVSLVFKRFED